MARSQNSSPTFPTENEISDPKITSTAPELLKLTESSPNKESIKKERLTIWKNVVGICLSFSCLFTAYGVASGLQSSLNSSAGLGVASQATVSVGQIASSMFLPALMINKFNLKWTMVIGELCYSTFIAAQFYPTFGTFIPTSLLVGIGAAALWCAKSIYLTKAGIRYAQLLEKHHKKVTEVMITRFFGVFFMISQLSGIAGNLLMSIVLTREPSNVTISNSINEERLRICGANYCNEDFENMTDSSGRPIIPPQSQVDMLFGILLGFSLLAVFFIIFLVDSPKSDPNVDEKSNVKALFSSFNHLKNPNQILLIPLTIWGGMSGAYIGTEFNAAFVTCSWGVENIGYVMIAWAASGALSSLGCGYVVKFVGRIPIFVFGSVINFSLILTMLFFWSPDPSRPEVFFVVAGFWAISNSVWTTSLNAFYGVIFSDKKEEAFSNFRLWQSLGYAIAYAYSKFLCVDVKLYILIAVLLTGMSGYLTIEAKDRSKNKQTNK